MPLPTYKHGTLSNQLITEAGTKIKVITFADPKIEAVELPSVIEAYVACQPYGTILVPETEATYDIVIKDQRDGKMYKCASTSLDAVEVGGTVNFAEIILE